MERVGIKQLLDWKNSTNHLPLIVNGARQVGKTWLIKDFAARYFSNSVYVSFDTNQSVANFIETEVNPKAIIGFLESWSGIKIKPGETLIIFDEIQSSEKVLSALKYFAEDAPEYHVIAAGSLLGVAINRRKYSFPVGKVQTVNLFPLNFEEFLYALDEKPLAERIAECFLADKALENPLHEKALAIYRKYLLNGGMPFCVQQLLDGKTPQDIQISQNEIINNYIADMAKYAEPAESVKIRAAYHSIPAQLAKENKKFQYKTVQKGGTAAIFGVAIEWLNFSGIVLKTKKLEHAQYPLALHEDVSAFKLYMGDTGLLSMKTGIAPVTILSQTSAESNFLGFITENYIAQEFAAKHYPLYYWESAGTAEIDFVLQKEDKIIPVEVKSGTNTRSRSLNLFMQKYQPLHAIRLSQKNFGFENNIKSVPLYATWCI